MEFEVVFKVGEERGGGECVCECLYVDGSFFSWRFLQDMDIKSRANQILDLLIGKESDCEREREKESFISLLKDRRRKKNNTKAKENEKTALSFFPLFSLG